MSITHGPLIEEYSPTLGELVCGHRMRREESMRAVSRRCEFTPADIAQVELGRAELDNEELSAVVHAYAVPRVRFPVNHSQVVVDLGSGGVTVRTTRQPVDESATDAMLLIYLELLYAYKDLAAGTEVAITSLDLDLVRIMLSTNREAVEARIDDLVLPAVLPAVRPVAPMFATRRPSSATALLVGAAAATVALAVTMALGSPRTSVAPVAESPTPQPIAVLQPSTALAPPVGSPAIDPRDPAASHPVSGIAPIEVRIIDPLIVTRQSDGQMIATDRPPPVQPSKETK